MPDWLKRRVDDFDPAYGLPVGHRYPAVGDMNIGLRTLRQGLDPADKSVAAECVAKLAVGANLQQSREEARMRLEVWWEANGDLPADLWRAGTTALLQGFKYGMPKPSDLRERVQAKLDERQRDIAKLEKMIQRAKGEAKPYEREPANVRIKGLRDTFKRIGQRHKAAMYEMQLAEMESRAPEEWATAPMAAPTAKPVEERPPFVPPTNPATERMRALGAAFRRQQDEERRSKTEAA